MRVAGQLRRGGKAKQSLLLLHHYCLLKLSVILNTLAGYTLSHHRTTENLYWSCQELNLGCSVLSHWTMAPFTSCDGA